MCGFAPRMDVLFWGQHVFPIIFRSLTRIRQGKLEIVIEEVYGRHGDHIKQYKVPLSRKLNDILSPDHIQWQPSTDQTLYQIVTILPNSTFYIIIKSFHRSFATSLICRQRTINLPDTWSRPFWDLQTFYPRYFLDFAWTNNKGLLC